MKKKTEITAMKITRTYGHFGRSVLNAKGFVELIEIESEGGERRKPARYVVLKELPTPQEYVVLRDSHFTVDLASRVEDAKATVESLKEEIEGWHDNMDGTGLENTEKYSQLDDVISQLEATIDALESANIPEAVADLPVVVLPTTRKRRSPFSRPNQQADAIGELGAVQDVLQEFCDRDGIAEDVKEEASSFQSQIEDAINEFEAVEFPSMYG